MTECPTCRLAMESHSTSELMECCMNQVSGNLEEESGVCPNCRHGLKEHTAEQLAECTIAFLKSGL